MDNPDYRIRTMALDDLALAVDWAAAEGWNPGVDDARAFMAADPGGFLIGELAGEPVSCISVVSYPGGIGFLGFYIVRPEFRGRGLGWAIWLAGMERLSGHNIGLDGVVAQQKNYRKSGFTLAWQNQRFEGVGGGQAPAGPVLLADIPFEMVLAYDRQCFATGRPAFLRHWIAQPGALALADIDDGELRGIGVIRPCRNGHKIGPLFADTEQVAERLFSALKASAPGDPIYLDVPRPNKAAVALAERHAMKPVFETARMYTRGDPGVPVERVFGVTSFELG